MAIFSESFQKMILEKGLNWCSFQPNCRFGSIYFWKSCWLMAIIAAFQVHDDNIFSQQNSVLPLYKSRFFFHPLVSLALSSLKPFVINRVCKMRGRVPIFAMIFLQQMCIPYLSSRHKNVQLRARKLSSSFIWNSIVF